MAVGVAVSVSVSVAVGVAVFVSVSVVHRSTRQRKAICSQQLAVAVGLLQWGWS